MSIRKPFRAGSFYPENDREIKSFIENYSSEYKPDTNIDKVIGGIVPHAGWVYSGPTAIKVYSLIRDKFKDVETFLIFGAVHIGGLRKASVFSDGVWQTPIGDVSIDDELSNMILNLSNQDIEENKSYHQTEHSIEVQVPIIHYLFPKAKILPIMTPPLKTMKGIGEKIGQLLSKSKKKVCIIGSTDLTHYGMRFGMIDGGTGKKGLEWMKSNDRRIVDLMLKMDTESIIDETNRNRNACGGGAILSTIASVKQMGANKGTLLEYTTSYDVKPYGDPSDAVGYAGIVF